MRKTLILFAMVAVVMAFSFTATDAQAGTISGVVLDSDGNAVEGAMVGIRGEHNDRRQRPHHDRAETGEDGTFEFTRVPGGNYMVMAGAREFGMAREEVAVRADGEVAVRLVLEPIGDDRGGDDERGMGAIVGVVLTPDGDGVAGAVVEISPMQNHDRRNDRRRVLRLQTDRQGNFVVAEIPEGRYMVRARVRGGMAIGRLEVEADQRNRIELTLQRHDRGDDRQRGDDRGRDG